MKLPWAQKRMLWPFEKSIFQVFAIFWVTKLKPFDGNVTQSVQISLNQSLLVVSFLENGFEATLGSKKNVVSVWKRHFSVFWKLLSDKVEAISWESEAKRSRLFKSKFGRGNFQENGFEATLSSNTNVLSFWKEHLSVFCKFILPNLIPFAGKVTQSVRSCLNENLVLGNFLENGFEGILSSKTNVVSLWKEYF